ncbi:MAG: aminotransferase class I/II-fold pyridoxal phosphate-dependent enzyme [Gemmatimonadaceae bacterium]
MSGDVGSGLPAVVDAADMYRRPQPSRPVHLKLDANEGAWPAIDRMAEVLLAGGPGLLRGYADASALEGVLAVRHGIPSSQVLVTAGADEAIDRCCRAFLAPGTAMLVTDPSFEMFERFASLAGGVLVRVPWTEGPFPTEELLARIDQRTRIIAVVSPNNPTGAVAALDDLTRVAAAAPKALILLDHAYVEYADDDLTTAALALPNVVVARTFSKAWGLAGCRVGFALATSPVIAALRAAGGPYSVAAPSVAFALWQLQHGRPDMETHVANVRGERTALSAWLAGRGIAVEPSQGNFVYATLGARAAFVHAALLCQGILVRDFPNERRVSKALRITLPGDPASFTQLSAALDLALAPDALLLDLDGVLADVEGSYRACVLATARGFGVDVTRDELLQTTLAGNANNDWMLTQRLLAARGVDRSLEEVTVAYQARYLGTDGAPGLRESEQLIVRREVVAALAARLPVAIVTGRPREEAEWFLSRAGIRDLVHTVVAFEDAPNKPDPAPVRLAMTRLGARRAWMVGDTPDDARAARAAGALALGVVAPGESRSVVAPALLDAGVALVFDRLSDLLEVL